MAIRKIEEVINARATTDGDGVNLYRVFGGHQPERFDPFLLLDEFGSDKSDDYIGGFPPHPHRGFSTVTYVLQGQFEHRDHMGNVGGIKDGGVQWMTAGSGVIHSEMPKQTEGKIRGLQLWLNLPASKKMMAPIYDNVEAEQILKTKVGELEVVSIAGEGVINGIAIKSNKSVEVTEPQYWDVQNTSQDSQAVNIEIENGRTVLLYILEGGVQFIGSNYPFKPKQLIRLSREGELQFSLNGSSRIMMLSANPLNEPIAQYGPFVMNTMEEIDKAVKDFQDGTLTSPEKIQA